MPETISQPTEWLRQAKVSMLRAGLPSAYVTRTCLELSDHLEQSERDENSSTLLGESPKDVAKAIVHSYRSRGLLQRVHPLLLLLLPLPLTVLLTLAYYAGCYVVFGRLVGHFDTVDQLPLHAMMIVWSLFYSGKLAGPALSAWVTFQLTKRMARPWHWGAALFACQSLAIAITKPELVLAVENSSLAIHCGSDFIFQTTQLLLTATIAMFGFLVVSKLRQQQRNLVA